MPITFRVQLCMTVDGTVQSLEEITEDSSLDNCTEVSVYHAECSINLSNRNIKRFKRGWYKLPGDFVRIINLGRNQIADITPELLNDLPSNVLVNLSSNNISVIEKNIMKNKYCIGLILQRNIIQTIENGAFEQICLSILLLGHNPLNNLDFMRSLPITIEWLDLSGNNLTEISPNIFQGLKKLRVISLNSNGLKKIEPGTFRDQESLVGIELDHNRISELHFELFKHSPMLTIISLMGNNITKITRDTFSGLRTSRKLDIYLIGNKIDTIEEGSFSHLNMSVLDLRLNRITGESIASGAFNMTTLETLDLQFNSITNLNGESFSGIMGFYTLELEGNPMKSIKNFFS